MSGVRLSVVIPTHNRLESLERLLARLRDGSYPNDAFEVVVVADGCSDATAATMCQARYGFALQVLEQNPGRGAAAARNLGSSVARGEILVFIDDDIEPLPRLLETHARLHDERDDLVVIGAPIPVRTHPARLDQIAAWAWWEQQFERMSQPGHRFTYDQVFSGILSVRASHFADAGRFQIDFNNCRDDSELGYRLFHAGGHMAFAREAGGIHHEVRNHVRLIVRKRAEGRADCLLAQRHPELWPALRISWPLVKWYTPLGAMRRLAFHAPRLGDVIASVLMWMLGPLERMHERGRWRTVEGGVMYYNYWRGVAAHLGSYEHFRELAGASSRGAAEVAAHANEHAPEIDIALGVDEAERALNALRPTALRIRMGEIRVGMIPYVPGAEPLRGAHLRALLGTDLVWPLSVALAIRVARSARAEELEHATSTHALEIA